MLLISGIEFYFSVLKYETFQQSVTLYDIFYHSEQSCIGYALKFNKPYICLICCQQEFLMLIRSIHVKLWVWINRLTCQVLNLQFIYRYMCKFTQKSVVFYSSYRRNGSLWSNMGGESSVLEENSDTQLHSAFKKLKVDPKW